jgi:pimeloyl-ACP methyl ester carboxylesterase
MLYIFGELDVNVPTEPSVTFIESLRRDYGKNITVLVLPGVGHLLYTWRGILEAGYPPGYLDFVGSWAARQVEGE